MSQAPFKQPQLCSELSHSDGPFPIDGHCTLPSLFLDRCKTLGERVAHREKDLGLWHSHSWADYGQHAEWVGMGLQSLGFERGECVCILSEDRREWMVVDLGIICMGGISCGVYTTDSAAQLAYLINDSGSRFLFVENDEQLDKALSARQHTPQLEYIIVIDDEGLHDFKDPQVIFLEALYQRGKQAAQQQPNAFVDSAAQCDPDDTAILVYTSGTTGQPKGGMISHNNIFFSLNVVAQCLPTEATDEQVCFLPLCHILERFFSCFTPIAFGSTVNFAESPETVFDNVQEISPHVFVAVPRVWEKIYSRLNLMIQEATPIGRWAYNKAISTGTARAAYLIAGVEVPSALERRYKLWDFLVFRNLRRLIGMDRLRRGTTGAAPISAELLTWYRAVGIPIYEGYGMTESAGLISLNTPEKNLVGSVGYCVPGADIRISEEGEIQYRAGNVFTGYWKKPEKTRETLTEDGWLKTGDIGEINDENFLTITGRLKDIIVTAGGKNIAPALLENALKFSPYISDAVVIGDRRKYLSCLIMIDQENVEQYAQERRVPFSDYASLCAADAVQELIQQCIHEVNQQVARVEQIKNFRLINTQLTAEDDELTATMKLKRSFVEKKYQHLIEQMYS